MAATKKRPGRKPAKKNRQFRANVTFFYGRRLVDAGDVVAGDDPILDRKRGEALFTEIFPDSDVEAATAAPGEKRNVTTKA